MRLTHCTGMQGEYSAVDLDAATTCTHYNFSRITPIKSFIHLCACICVRVYNSLMSN